MNIEWRVCPLNDLYEVSSDGRVRRVETGRELCIFVGSDGYPQVGMSRDNVAMTRRLHRLVALAFLGPRPEGYHAAHRNGDATDNRLENIEYITAKENSRDIDRHGRRPRGEACSWAKLTTAQVLEARARYRPRHPQHGIAALAREFGMSRSVMRLAVQNETWTHV